MTHKKTAVIWDLSGTLFRPSKEDMTKQEIADYSFVFLMWSGKKERSRLDSIAYDVLGMLGQQPDNEETIRVHTGEPLPQILCSYLAGHIHSEEALNRTLTFFNTWAPHHISKEDEQQLRRMFKTFFDPQALVNCMKPIEPAVELMLKTSQKNDPLSILSNWDHDSFIPFYQKYKDSVLAPFPRKHIVISADAGYVKPQRGIYKYLIEHNNLEPQNCFFIDDQQENVKASQALGVDAIQFQLNHINEIEGALKKLDLI